MMMRIDDWQLRLEDRFFVPVEPLLPHWIGRRRRARLLSGNGGGPSSRGTDTRQKFAAVHGITSFRPADRALSLQNRRPVDDIERRRIGVTRKAYAVWP